MLRVGEEGTQAHRNVVEEGNTKKSKRIGFDMIGLHPKYVGKRAGRQAGS